MVSWLVGLSDIHSQLTRLDYTPLPPCFVRSAGMQPAVRADVLGTLQELLEDVGVRKVGHCIAGSWQRKFSSIYGLVDACPARIAVPPQPCAHCSIASPANAC